MLGEVVGEESGQTTGFRVLPSEGTTPTVEVSFQASGTLLGVEETNMGTYSSVVRPDGTLRGAGRGVVMTKDGGMAAWRGGGVGRFTGRGTAVSWGGARYAEAASR